ncbi:uncharacterized protein [Triticum aestivum]|uniref:uncharacterized protein isoform X1 n=1 Tax=Triticum aestivum TaxID=4565 RepID=UPI001D016666|nr:uncharacterized protein LOC123154059 isoform X1 [Triticum aestivum]
MFVRTSTPCGRPPPPLQRTPGPPPPLSAGDGKPISSLQCGLPDKLERCLERAAGLEQYLENLCSSDSCDYLQTLKMHLHGMIHICCVKVLKLLPKPSGSLMRAFLMAGHCYGSMDPVSNIIVNSIWDNSHGCPLPESERSKIEQYNDILDPLSLLRTQVHSLKGLVELAKFAILETAHGGFSTEGCALELLCSAGCDVFDRFPSSAGMFKEKKLFHEVAKAAGHPLPLQLGELHEMLMVAPEGQALLSLTSEAQIQCSVLRIEDMTNHISRMWRGWVAAKTGGVVQAPKLFPKSLMFVSSMRSKYEERRSWFRSKIEQVLKDYTTQHFWEQQYKLDIICGVEAINKGRPPLGEMCYRVNFTATSHLERERRLFFAEFLFSGGPRPETCCPLPYDYAGRCYYGEQTARKIVYPDDAKYIPHDITHPGTRRVDDMLEMDVVHFSSEMDVELAEKLNKMHAN